jgi:putative protease
VENGADAIYFGLDRFNARMRARNFTVADLPGLMEFLHRRGVKGYLTFNTLVFTPELADAEDFARTVIAAGVDAAIVQDVGIARLIRSLSPDFPIHCSTQMTITSAAGIEFAHRLGAQLVVLARENNLTDIEAIQKEQCYSQSQALDTEPGKAAHSASPLPLEVFVHGALCVAYSGQCLTSESLGGRSANRGECAQACRLPYELFSDGTKVYLGDRKYLLSPKDLSAIDVIPDLVRLGVASFKIEGRLKSAEYVASITRVYRRAIDTAWSRQKLEARSQRTEDGDPVGGEQTEATRYELEMSFSRGLFTGWFRGTDNRQLVHARFGTKRGVFLGEVSRIVRDTVFVRLEAPLKPGDGIVFDAGTPEKGEEGGRVYEIDRIGSEAGLRFGRGDLDLRRVNVGNKVWKTSDPALERELRGTFEGEKVRFQRPISLEVHGHAGAPLTVIARDAEGHIAQSASSTLLIAAETRPLSIGRLREQLGRLGGTPFKLGELTNFIEGQVMLPVSKLNLLRRDFVAELERQRAKPLRWTLADAPESRGGSKLEALSSKSDLGGRSSGGFDKLPPSKCHGGHDRAGENEFSVTDNKQDKRVSVSPIGQSLEPELIALVRHLPQLEAAWGTGIRTIYCEFENPKIYRDAVVLFRELQSSAPSATSSFSPADAGIWAAPPRVHKPGEDWILKLVRSCDADGYLMRNYDHLRFFEGARLRGDYSLNIANPLAAEYFIREYRLERVAASYDLSAAQLEALLAVSPAGLYDITLHQHMPMFHMEHCVFCAFLSNGRDYRDCGRPCDRHRVELRDRVGALLPLKADAGCRNTVFNNRAQTGAEFLPRFLAAGARHFRIEFVDEAPDEVSQTLLRYRQLLDGDISGAELWREFKLINQIGVTRGQLEGGRIAASVATTSP